MMRLLAGKQPLFLTVVVILVSLACRLVNPSYPTATVVIPPPVNPPTIITPSPQPSLSTIPAVNLGVLPAPLYFVSAADNQVWRLEIDGATLKQLTFENSPVLDFDVFLLDGSLAYVSNNKLIRTDAAGANRTILVDGPTLSEDDWAGHISGDITSPRWSPDGTHLAYGMNGANLISVTGGDIQSLQPSDPMPDLNTSPPPSVPVRFYRPSLWSPDGLRLLLDFSYFMEGGGLAVKNLADGSLVPLNNPEGMTCCYPSWSIDGQSIYFAYDAVGMLSPGLWLATVSTGNSNTLIPGGTDPNYNLIAYPQALKDGQLYFFFAAVNGIPEGRAKLTMYRSGLDGGSGRTALRADTYALGSALWATDGSGAVIQEITTANPPFNGPLLWLPSNGGPAIALPATGSESMRLCWGPAL